MEKYVNNLKTLFEKNTIIENIEPMSNYMRGQFDYFGIKTPLRKELTKQFVQEHGYPTIEEVPEFMQLIWDETHREMHHVVETENQCDRHNCRIPKDRNCQSRPHISDIAICGR